jgi:two-component system cell cycle sensor histidine kinase/response regulator CckA
MLVVDDDPSVRAFAERALREAGYDLVVAIDGPTALELVAHDARGFDLAVIDLMMPVMTGDVVAAALRRVHPDLKVLYFTGFGDDLFKQRGTLGAYEAYLDKPVTMKGLLEAVSLLLYGHTQGPPGRSS